MQNKKHSLETVCFKNVNFTIFLKGQENAQDQKD